MNANPLPSQEARDEQHLKLLSVFYYVSAGLGALGLLFIIAHGVFMVTMFSTLENSESSQGEPMPEELLPIMTGMYAVMALAFIIVIVMDILSARFLKQNRYRTFSMIVAGINCLNVPLGTVLGVFTIIVLMRESVQERYRLARTSALEGQNG